MSLVVEHCREAGVWPKGNGSYSAVRDRGKAANVVNQRDYLGGGLREIELDAISPSALCGIQGDVSALNQPV